MLWRGERRGWSDGGGGGIDGGGGMRSGKSFCFILSMTGSVSVATGRVAVSRV